VHRLVVDAVHGLHHGHVVLVGIALHDFVRLLLEKPERDHAQHDAAAAADRQREEVLPPFPGGAQRLFFALFFHGPESMAEAFQTQ
jgi:hypothetical protein